LKLEIITLRFAIGNPNDTVPSHPKALNVYD
jgi:hypothetical protein